MKKGFVFIALLFLMLVLYTVIFKPGNLLSDSGQVLINQAEPVVAVFHSREENSYFETFEEHESYHFTMRLGRSFVNRFETQFIDTIPLNKKVLLTLETWEQHLYHRNTHQSLTEIYQGDYDSRIIRLCEEVLSRHPNILLRWNPEMEVPAGLYPWQNRPYEYIEAYRHLDSLVNYYSPETKMVWAPAGYPGVTEFWPGSEFVDVASITLNSKSESLVTAYPREDSSLMELKRKLHRLRFFDVPVIILSGQGLPEGSSLLISERENFSSIYQNELPSNDKAVRKEKLILGLYDPAELLVDNPALNVEHLFVDFERISDGRFRESFSKVSGRNHDVIVTMEPMFPSAENPDRKVLDKIVAGQYDSLFSDLFNILKTSNQKIYLRFAHEMEIPILRYPWQSQDPVLYIRAFRHFMQLASEKLPGAIKVWGPAGDRGSLEWWPGDPYVDMISIAIYGLPDKNITDPLKQESFETIYNRKYRRMRFVNKPVFITEFGVKGPENYQNDWLENAANVIRNHPEIIGVNYFNMVDNPEVWGEGMKPPDWSITKESFDQFVAAVNGEQEL